MNLAGLREEVAALTRALERRRYEVAAGLAPTARRVALFRGTGEAIGPDGVQLVREAREKAEGRRAVRLNALEAQLGRLVAEADSAASLDELESRESAAVSGTEPGQQWPLHLALHLASREADREKRARAESRVVDAVEALHPMLARQWETPHSGTSSQDAVAFLKATEAMYFDVLEWWLRRVTGQGLGAERHDLLHALWLAPFDGLFPRDVTVLQRFASAGFTDDDAIRFDGEAREGKRCAPRAAPLDAPDDVIAVFRGQRGVRGAHDLLRAWGEAAHFAGIDPARPFEDRGMGDRSVPAAMGVLFQNVLLDETWLKKTLEQAPSDLIRVLALQELFRLRHLAAVSLATAEIARDGVGGSWSEQAAETLSEALGARWPNGLMLWECSTPDALRTELSAAALEAVLFPHLRDQFDEDWWANPRAGVFLRKVFAQGQFESAGELAKSRGLAEPSLLAAAPRLARLLG